MSFKSKRFFRDLNTFKLRNIEALISKNPDCKSEKNEDGSISLFNLKSDKENILLVSLINHSSAIQELVSDCIDFYNKECIKNV